MRISTSQIFDAGALGIQNGQSGLFKLQNQLSSGRKVLTPKDDPVAAAQALVVTQSRDVNSQFMVNQGQAKSQLGLVDSQLTAVVQSLHNVREKVVQAGNTTLTNANAGRPKLSPTTDMAAIRVSNAVNLPCWNSVDTNGTDSSIRPSAAGIAISSVVRNPQSSDLEKPSASVRT